QSLGKLFAPIHFIGALLSPTNFHEFSGSTVDRCCFMLLVYTLIVLWWTDKGWFLWAVCLGVVPAITGTFVSFTRFASVIFPLFVVWSVPLSRPRPASKCLRLLTVLVFSLFHVILVWRFVNYRWAG